MIGTIRKHSKTMWWVIIFAIIITFVWWGTMPSQTGGGGGPDNLGRINQETITINKFRNARAEVFLFYFFGSGGGWPDAGRTVGGFDVERETYFRLLVIQKQREMGIHVSDEAVARVAAERLRALYRGDPVPPEVFEKEVLGQRGMTLTDFERYIRHELGLQQMASVLGLGGELVTPQEVRALYERENQELQTLAVFFSASNHLNSVKVTPERVGEFFTNQMARYRLPERAQVNYVKFPLSNFLAEAVQKINENTNLNELLEAVYQQRGTNFYSEAKTPEEAKQKILEEEQKGLALEFARRKAAEFAMILYTNEPPQPEHLVTLAKAQELTPLVTEPFSRDEPPAGLDVRADFLRAAFALTADEPFSQTLLGNDGAYLISLNKTLPSEIPSLEDIRERVTQDFQFVEAVMQARKAGMDFVATATNVTDEASFTAACASAGIKPVTLPPFALSTRSLEAVEAHANLSQFKQAAFGTPAGQLSRIQPANDGAYVVFVQKKLPLDPVQMLTNLPAFERSVRQARRNEAFNDWFRREAEKGLSGIPYFQQPAQLFGQP